MSGLSTIEIRRAEPADRPAVLALLRTSLGWKDGHDDERLFAWKHTQSPFGASPSWVAVHEGRVVGFRTFLRWEFDHRGEVVRAVRAVDTATHPAHRGQGIFSRLTLQALDELRAEGVAFVFNTPNDQSRPGYLKMGWQPVGRLPLLMRPAGVGSLARLATARRPAERWSQPSEAGVSAGDAFAAYEVLETGRGGSTLGTRRDLEFLRWRYAAAPLRYRVVAAAAGLTVFRLRRRGGSLEAAVCDVLAAKADTRRVRSLLRLTLRESRADYAIRLGGPGIARAGFLPLPGQGPLLLWRALAWQKPPSLAEWCLTLGDIELF